ncbi:MAG: thiamine-phosphate kinase [Acidobacteriota bacterium]|nr:thiamine-phosphate kinase [Acidobacteriota bacterium]
MSRLTRLRPRETEETLLRWLSEQEGTGGLIGDDAAILDGHKTVVTVDSQVAGTHFPADLDSRVLAERLLAVNLSDLAAMGARPTHGFLALVADIDFDHRDFFGALLPACRRAEVTLAGGDLASGPATTLSLTLIGRRWPRSRGFVRRDTARPGDRLWIGPGSLGESAIGCALALQGGRLRGRRCHLPPGLPARFTRSARAALRRHFAPRPQLELGRWLASRNRAAATDISDGLGRDLHQLCEASGVGAVVESDRLPIPTDLSRLAAALDLDPLELAIGGGEDYNLLFTLGPHITPPSGLGALNIGTIDATNELRLCMPDETILPIPNTGFDHLTTLDHGPG